MLLKGNSTDVTHAQNKLHIILQGCNDVLCQTNSNVISST